MMESVQPGPSSGAGSPPQLPDEAGERHKESSSKGLRRLGQGELDALGKLAELWHRKPWGCPSLFRTKSGFSNLRMYIVGRITLCQC